MVAVVTGNGLGLQRTSGFVLGSGGSLGDTATGRLGSNVTVNAATGNLIIQNQDELLVGKGPDSVFSRSYNSLGLLNDENGDNWRESSQRTVAGLTGTVNTAGSTITRTDWDGSNVAYAWDASRSAYVSKEGAGAYDTLTFASNVWTWTDGNNRVVETYDNLNGGRITSSKDTDLNSLSFTYNGSGLLTRVTTQSGDYTDLSYTGTNLTQLITKTSGGTILSSRMRYSYDTSNRLQTVTVDLTPADNSVTDSNVVTYTYTYDGTSKRVASISESGSANFVSFGYTQVDADYRITSVTETGSDGGTRVTNFSYNTTTRVTTVTDALGKITELTYDTSGNLTQIKYPPAVSGASPQIVQYAYNGNGDVTSVTDAAGKVVTYSYDANGNLTRQQDAAGNTVDRIYGSNNELLNEIHYLAPASGGALIPTGSNLIVNGSFESMSGTITVRSWGRKSDSIPGWTKTNNSVFEEMYSGSSGINSTDGTYWLELDGDAAVNSNMNISQTVNGLTAGQVMLLQFDHANATTAESGSFAVYWNGNLIGQYDYEDLAMETENIQVTAVAGANTLSFVGLGTADGAGAALDNVRLFATTAGTAPSTPVVTRYAYDGENHLRFAIDADGFVTEYQYDAAGQLVTTLKYTSVAYNVSSLASAATLSETTMVNVWLPTLSATDKDLAERTETAYDFRGNVANIKEYSDASIVSVYDANRVHYSGFESGSNGWAIDDNPSNIITSTTTGTNANKAYFKGTFTATAANQFMSLGTDNTHSFNVTAGERLALQMGVEALGPISSVRLRIVYQNASNTWFSPNTVMQLNGTQTFGTKLSGFATVPAGAVRARLEVYCYTSGSGTGSYSLIEPMASLATSGQSTFPAYSPGALTDDMSVVIPTSTASSYTQTTYVYDQFGLLLSRQKSGISGSETYTYDGLGRVLTATDFAAATTTTAINDGTRTTTVTLANGLVKTSTYTAQGELASYAVSGSDVVTETETYKYDKLGRLRITNDALSQPDFSFYDDAGRRVGYMDRRGNLIEYQYDAANRLIATISYNTPLTSTAIATLYSGGNPTTATLASVRPTANANDIWNWNIYDSADRLIQTIGGTGSVTIYAYDGDDRLVQTTRYANVIATAMLTGYKTTPPTAIVLPTADTAHDQVTRFFYDNSGRKIGALDGTGSFTQINYDKAGRAIETVRYANFVSSGLRASGTFAQLVTDLTTTPNTADRHTYLVYNRKGDVRYTLDANLRPTEYVYDSAGNVIRTIDYGASITSNTSYSLSYVQGQISTLSLAANAATRVTRHVYDGAGRKAFEINAEGYVTAYAFNSVGQITKETRYAVRYIATDDPAFSAMQSWATTNANGADRVSRQVFDALGLIAYQVDAEGYVTEHQYDLNDRVKKDIRYAAQYTVADGVTKSGLAGLIGSPAGAVTKLYAYDISGNLSDVTNGEGAVTHYEYDAFDRAISIKEAYGTSDEAETQITFDTAGRAISKTTANGTANAATTGYEYDGNGNLVSIWDPKNYPLSPSDPTRKATKREYDANGNIIRETVPLDATTNAVTERAYNAFGQVWKLIDPRLNPGYFYYDKLGRLDLQIDAEGYATQTSYNIGDQPASVTRYYTRATNLAQANTRPTLTTNAKDATTSFTYDKLDRLTRVTDAEQYLNAVQQMEYAYEEYTLNAFGDRVVIRNRLGGITNNVFYKNGLLKQETLVASATKADGVIQASTITNSFVYDARGNRTQMVEAVGLLEQRTTTYSYDKNNRLRFVTTDAVHTLNADRTNTTLAALTEERVYDLRGNVIEVIDPAGDRTLTYYDDNDRKIAEVKGIEKIGSTIYGALSVRMYDLNGNMISQKIYGDKIVVPSSAVRTIPAPVNASNSRETLYDYDKNNRLSQTRYVNIPVGERGSSGYAFGIQQNVIYGTTYDAAGNVIVQTDARLNKVFSFYDKNGRKIAQVDQENYLTTYDVDSEGNILTETRFANRLTAVVGSGSDVTALKANAGNTANDHITQFTYDRNGRRKSETRLNMGVSTVNATTGALSWTSGQSVTISFEYNGLGLVTKKTEANLDVTETTFDLMGRIIKIQEAAYLDHNGVSVRPTTEMAYDGLNQLSRQAVRGSDNGSETDDRITRFFYDKAGRVIQTIDPTNFTTDSNYDAAGRLVKQSWTRFKSDTVTSIKEAQFYSYDLAGREIGQVKGTFVSGTTWTLGDSTSMLYNGFGDMIARGINVSDTDLGNVSKYQEFADYDQMGRVWRTNFGDGVTKAYVYDANGNATLLLQTTGSDDLRPLALNDIIALTGTGGATQTQSVFDKRNQLVETVQPSISNAGQLNGSINSLTPIFGSGQSFTGGPASIGPVSGVSPTNPGVQGSLVAARAGSYTVYAAANNYQFTVTGGLFAAGGLRFFYNYNGYTQELTSSYSGGTYYVQRISNGTAPGEKVTVTQDIGPGLGQRVLLDNITRVPGPTPPYSTPPVMEIRGMSSSATRLIMFARPQGSSGPYQIASTSQLAKFGGGVVPSGWFSVDVTAPPFNGIPANNAWDIKFYAMDANGVTYNSQTATLSIDGSGNPSITNITSQNIGGPGSAVLTREGPTDYLIASELTGATYVRMRYRVSGSGSGWSEAWLGNTGYGQNGLWAVNLSTLSLSSSVYEYWIDSFSGSWAQIGQSKGAFNIGGQSSTLTAYTNLPDTVHFYSQPAGSQTFKFWYKSTSSGTWLQSADLTQHPLTGAWDWDANGLPAGDYDFRYEVYNSSSQLLNKAHGQVRVGASRQVLSNIADFNPTLAKFNPTQAAAATMVIQYRQAGSTSSPYTSITIPKAASGLFEWNVEALRPGTGSITYEYMYDVYNVSGALLPADDGEDHTRGYLEVTSAMQATTRDLQWVLVGSPDPAAIIDRKQGYDAFGHIVYEIDGLNRRTDLKYNVMGKLIEKQSPETSVTGENGVVTRLRPTERYYYDISGRLVGVQDANSVQIANGVWGNGAINKLLLLAGSGHTANDNAIALKEFHADGGVKIFGVDVFGDVRKITDELLAVTLQNFDKAARLTQVIRPTRLTGNSIGVSLTDEYRYDELGQRTKHWNSQFGAGVVETTDFDLQGRVTSTKDFEGNVMSYGYTFYPGAGTITITTPGLGAFGGWQKSTSMGGLTSWENTDIFGRLTWKSDFGGHAFGYAFDKAGRLTTQTGVFQGNATQNIAYTYYGNGYIRSVTDVKLGMQSIYEYDKEGNRTFESYTSTDSGALKKYYQVADIAYDELNRVKTFTDAKATINYEYDADSNRRRVLSTYQDGLNGYPQTQDFWYRYDSMNRFTLTMGQLVSGAIVKGSKGVEIAYNAASQRVYAINGSNGTREDYTYTADGYLEDTLIDDPNDSVAGSVLRARRVNDALGRVTVYTEYGQTGLTGGSTYKKESVYDKVNRTAYDKVTDANGLTEIWNDYKQLVSGAYTGADRGVITHSRQVNGTVTAHTTYDYAWWDEGKQTDVMVKASNSANPNSYKWAPGTSHLEYDVNGHLAKATFGTGASEVLSDHTITYESDAYGQVLVREEKTGSTLNSRQLHYYFNGNRIGDVSTDGASRVDYATRLAQRALNPKPGDFRQPGPIGSADFDQNYEPIGPDYPAQAASYYTVRAGDTLQSIAQALWGDSSMWYLIADANGLSDGSAQLQTDQRLIIPNKVTNIHNRVGVYRVYDPGEAIGDTLPTLPAQPAPPKKGGCGVFGKILMIVVAVVVTAIALPAAAPTVLQGMLAGAAGAAASQTFGVVTGIQDKFSFKSVALAAIAGGVSAGLGNIGFLDGAKGLTGVVQDAARGALTNVATQGISVATGLQHKFDWTGVAAAGVLSGVGGIAERFARSQGLNTWTLSNGTPLDTTEYAIGGAIRGVAGAIAGAATRSALDGTDFGDNILAVMPDVIGNTIGNTIGTSITARQDRMAEVRADLAAQSGNTSLADRISMIDIQGVADDQTSALSVTELSPQDRAYIDLLHKNLSGVTNRPASIEHPIIGGLYRNGNRLTGDIAVKFSNLTAIGDEQHSLRQMTLINQKADGYSIDLTFHKASFFESTLIDLGIYSGPYIDVIYVNGFKGDVLGQEDPWSLAVKITPNSPQHVTTHELGHRLGAGHSGIPESVMFPKTRASDIGHYQLSPQEIKNIVTAYPKQGKN